MSFEPQTAVRLSVIPVDAAFEQSPTIVEVGLLACPDDVNMQIELLSVGYRANTLPVDAGDNIQGDLQFIDDTDDSVTTLVSNYTFDDNRTALIVNSVWRGSQILDAGDVINFKIDDVSTPDTASEGAAFIVEYRVLRRS
ncbi:hypothetical protein LCGC14_0295070 [marine sediment metagenome]|uniref:Uncharacterized protein n=1 Tax=marine sediment metagenome TaxID=412755 RepID=A0A0F9TX43_9ZZZZ